MIDTSNQEYTRFSISSEMDNTGSYSIASYDKDIRVLTNAIKSALPKDAYFSLASKEVSQNGKLSVDVYVHQEDALNVQEALNKQTSEMTFKGSPDKKYSFVQGSQNTISKEVTQELRREDYRQVNKEEIKEEQAKAKERLSLMLKIAGTVTVLTDIARRILTSVLNMASQSVADATSARNLGISYSRAKELGYVETAHGLQKGTMTEAMADIQSKFGNITDIDEKALGQLALVMGSEIEDLVKSGIGGDRPEELLGKILDAYMKQANAGYNSIGQQVGESEARRELYSQLNRISPKIADIFAMMQEDLHNVNSIYRGQADTYEGWKGTTSTNRFGYDPAELGLITTLGQQTNQVKSLIEQIKTGILIKMAPTLTEALKKIANSRAFMNEEDSWKLDDEHKKANTAFINQIDKQLALIPEESEEYDIYKSSRDDRVRGAIRAVLQGAKIKATNENAKLTGIDDKTLTLNQILVEAYKIAESDYKSALSFGGMGGKAPYDTDTMWKVINHYLGTGALSESDIEAVKNDKVKKYNAEINKLNKKISKKDAKKRIDEDLKDIENDVIAKTREEKGNPYLTPENNRALWDAVVTAKASYLGVEPVKNKQNGKLYIPSKYYYTDENISKTQDAIKAENEARIKEIEAEIEKLKSTMTSDEIAYVIFDKYGESLGLTASAEKLGLNEIKKAIFKNIFFSASLIDEEKIKQASNRLTEGVAYNTYGYTDSTGTYRLVLDINTNKEADENDLVLWEGQGADFFQGNLETTYTINSDGSVTRNNMMGTSASSQPK